MATNNGLSAEKIILVCQPLKQHRRLKLPDPCLQKDFHKETAATATFALGPCLEAASDSLLSQYCTTVYTPALSQTSETGSVRYAQAPYSVPNPDRNGCSGVQTTGRAFLNTHCLRPAPALHRCSTTLFNSKKRSIIASKGCWTVSAGPLWWVGARTVNLTVKASHSSPRFGGSSPSAVTVRS